MKDETLLPDVASLEKVLEWIAGLPVPTKSATANYCRLKNFIIDYNAALQSGNSAQPEPVNKTYKLPPNSFSDDELMGMAHGDNPVANACRELLEFRRNAAGGNSAQPVTVPAGYVLMPMKLTAENGAKYALSGEFHVLHRVTCHECGGEGCSDCDDDGWLEEKIMIGWDDIKDIYRAAVEACSIKSTGEGV